MPDDVRRRREHVRDDVRAPKGGRRADVLRATPAIGATMSSATMSKRRRAPQSRAVTLAVRAAASDEPSSKPKKSDEKYSNLTKMRSEAQAPFRTARMFVFGAFAANAALGLSIATLQAVTKALGAPSAPPLDQSLQNIGIDLGAALFFGYLYKKDAENREKQMARISREERLSALKCELSSGKVVSLFDLRGFSRVVIAAGDADYCNASIAAAEAVRDPLLERGGRDTLVLGDAQKSVNAPTTPRTDGSGPPGVHGQVGRVDRRTEEGGQGGGW